MKIPLWQFYADPDVDKFYDHDEINVGIWIRTFFRETSFQGIPMIIREPGLLKKLFWVAAIALCAYGLAWECDEFFDKFLSWKANTQVTIETARILPFPAITLCNNNPVTSDWNVARMEEEQKEKDKDKDKDGQMGGPEEFLSGMSMSGMSGSGFPSGMSMSGLSVSDEGPLGGGQSGSGSLSGMSMSGLSGSGFPSGMSGGDSLSGMPMGGPPPGGRKKRQLGPGGPGGPGGHYGPSFQGGADRKPKKKENFAARLQDFLSIQGKVAELSYPNRTAAGHQLCDMIFEMQYEGVSLAPGTNMSTWHWNEVYGNCFTFNGGLTRAESTTTATDTWTIKMGGTSGTGVRTSSQSGDMFGLYLLLNADVEHYMSITEQVGWRIVIHNQTEMPFPQESGIVIEPGTSTRIGVSLNYVERLGIVDTGLFKAPYSDCVDREELVVDDPVNAYSNMLEVSYTKSACLKTCYQQNVMKECGCFDFNYPNEGSAFADYPDIGPCLYSNETDWVCKLGVASDYHDGNIECDCPNTCKSYSFGTTISSLGWPNPATRTLPSICDRIFSIVKKRANNSDETCVGNSYFPKQSKDETGLPELAKDLQTCAEERYERDRSSMSEHARFTVGSRLAEVFIYYKDFNYQTVIEHEMMEIPDLIAYMGGIVGLFFGFTFLTLFEYIQLVIDLIIIGCSRLFCARKPIPDGRKLSRRSVAPLRPFKPHSASEIYGHNSPSAIPNGDYPFIKQLDQKSASLSRRY